MQQTLFGNDPVSFNLPDAELSYYPDFIDNQQQLYNKLLTDIQWRQDTLSMYGKSVAIPRLNAWYGDADAHYGYSGLQLHPQPWTDTLNCLKQQLLEATGIMFNSVLANYYRDEQDSVAWHSDDETELGIEPTIASLSFGATRRFSLRSKTLVPTKMLHIDLHGGSLLLMAGKTQSHWQHQLAKVSKPMAGRVNLTFRRITVAHKSAG